MPRLSTAIWKVIRNTHRHPANIALHSGGIILYASGIGSIPGHFAGYDNGLLQGAVLWLAGVAAFTLGHMIEGNLGSLTPVLACRLISRNVRHYFAADRIHV